MLSKEFIDIPALYDAKGRYGSYNIPALTCYITGILIQIPFLNLAFYEGFIARMLDGADISWIVSLIVTAAFYYIWAKNTQNILEQMIMPGNKNTNTFMTSLHGG